jgi:hypothetical protein
LSGGTSHGVGQGHTPTIITRHLHYPYLIAAVVFLAVGYSLFSGIETAFRIEGEI